jgi:hypothetical protein
MYAQKIREVLSPVEKQIFAKLKTPQKIQDYLDSLPINFEISGETYMSPRRTLREKTAHCFEGALVAAAVLAYHGQKPLLLDLKTADHDEDHVVTLFKENGRWGAISKTNHAVLRYRDAIYKDVRELAMSYFHEYILPDGEKTLRSFSKPFDLSRYKPERWVTAEDDLFWLVEALDDSPHVDLMSAKQIRTLRNASSFEVKATAVVEWKRSKAPKRLA